MREKLAPVWLLAGRELKDQLRDWRILFPLVVLTFFFPLLTNSFAGEVIGFMNRYGGDLILDRMVPFSILIIGFFPVTVALVVALEAFVGEKERGTIEPLLSSPLLDWQLYLGKLFVGILFPLLASYVGIAFYLVIISRQDLNLPPALQIAQLLALTFAHSVLMVSAAIVVSTQATSVRAANLLASFIVIPVALLIQGESVLLFWGKNDDVLWLATLGVLVLAAIFIRVGIAHFQREYLLGREVDKLNLKWLGRTFWQEFRGSGTTLWAWYQEQVGGALRRLRKSILLVILLAVVSSVASYLWVSELAPVYLSELPPQEIDATVERISASGGFASLSDDISFGYIFSHNVRTVLIVFVLGFFSFGILGQFLYIINIGVIGGVLAGLNYVGLSAFHLFLAGILPHGIFELPAIMLAGAAVLHLGAALITPSSKTMGEVVIYNLADWAKVFVGVILPLLLVAALVETYITPHLLLNAM